MKQYLVVIFFGLWPCLAQAQQGQGFVQEACNPANGHAYVLLQPSSWTQAESAAVSLGGHLATINDAAENTWVWTTFEAASTGNIWIGLNDINVEGTFEWSSGEPFVYQYWHWSEPNDLNGAEDYGCMWGWYGGEWNDFDNAPYGWGDWYGVVEISTFWALQATPGIAGVSNDFQACNATPGSTIWFVASSRQAAVGAALPGCAGVTTQLLNPITVLGSAVADAQGMATVQMFVPTSLAGATGYVQAVDLANCSVSNLAVVHFN